MNKPKALIMEDDPASNKLLVKTLSNKNFTVVTCTNAAEGLYHYFNEPNFDVIVLDIMMPEVGGIDFLKVVESLRARQVLKHDPKIIVETAVKNYTDLKYITSLMSVHSVHEKPLSLEKLSEAIDDVIRARSVSNALNKNLGNTEIQ